MGKLEDFQRPDNLEKFAKYHGFDKGIQTSAKYSTNLTQIFQEAVRHSFEIWAP